MRRINRKRPEFIEISMLNLIDVIFILLIFFMLSTTFSKYWHYEISLPKTNNSENITKENNIKEVILNKDLNLYIKSNKNLILIDDINKYIKSSDIVLLSADKEISYDNLIKTISIIKNSNINKIKLNIER